MTDSRPLEIPADLDRWHPNEIGEWLSSVEDDVATSDVDVDRARQAVHRALAIH